MAEIIPQSIAKRVPLKAYLSDGITDATGKTIAVVISKNGGAFANPSAGATNATEIASGWYYVDLSTTDTNTLGPLLVRGTATGVDNSEVPFTVAVANVAQTGDSFARLGAPAGASVSADIAAIKAVVDAIKAKTDQLTFTISNKVDSSIQAAGDFAQAAADKVWLTAARTLTSFGTLTADVADKILARNLAGGSDGGRTVQDALRILRNKRSITAGTLTVTIEDDATPAWTAAVATAVSNPVSAIDPA